MWRTFGCCSAAERASSVSSQPCCCSKTALAEPVSTITSPGRTANRPPSKLARGSGTTGSANPLERIDRGRVIGRRVGGRQCRGRQQRLAERQKQHACFDPPVPMGRDLRGSDATGSSTSDDGQRREFGNDPRLPRRPVLLGLYHCAVTVSSRGRPGIARRRSTDGDRVRTSPQHRLVVLGNSWAYTSRLRSAKQGSRREFIPSFAGYCGELGCCAR